MNRNKTNIVEIYRKIYRVSAIKRAEAKTREFQRILSKWIRQRIKEREYVPIFHEAPSVYVWNIYINPRKFSATLYSLKNMKVREQAAELGISYGVLRKWRTELAFKEWINRHEHDFLEYIDDYELKNKHKKNLYDPYKDRVRKKKFKIVNMRTV